MINDYTAKGLSQRFDWPEKTADLLAADGQALVVAGPELQKKLDKLQIVVDDCINLCLCNRVQNDLLQAQVKFLSQRIDAITELMPILKEYNKQNKGESK